MANDTAQLLHDKAVALAESAKQLADVAQGLVAQGGSLTGAMAHGASGGAIDPFIFEFALFILAVFVGYFVVWAVTPALHTPLMSVTNAISSVIVVGALLAIGVDASSAGEEGATAARFFGLGALILASVNIFGGFLVTERMLAMYKKKG